jgi:glycine/sarcosine N-methyltransferase
MDYDPVAGFYDRLAPYYSLIFPDWRKSMAYQAEVLDRLIGRYIPTSGSPGSSKPGILDCACGIGTQAIGLALKGYRVHGTDISSQAVERARVEAEALNAPVTFGVADFRHLDTGVPGLFDVVLCCDNSLPHLLTRDDLLLAVKSIRSKLQQGGLLFASIRDYDRLLQEKPTADTPRIFDGPEGRRIVLQVWDWEPDEPVYTFSHFILRQVGSQWETIHGQSRYRALLQDELDAVLSEAGFTAIEWHMPPESGYYQPIVTALA